MAQAIGTTLLVWDRQGEAPRSEGIVVLWRDFAGAGQAVRSIPRHLEDRADALRARYLAWVHDLGREPVRGKSIVDRLELRRGFSFWWMTLLVEKSNAFNSPQIVNALKLFALEDMLGREWRGRVILDSGDPMLAGAMRGWCRNAGLEFTLCRGPRSTPTATGLRKWLRRLPAGAQALVTFARYFQLRGALRGVGSAELARTPAPVTFCSYLFNLDKRAAADGRLVSSFWTDLHGLLERHGSDVNWLFLIVEHAFVPGAARGRELIEAFNRTVANRGAHAVLDGELGWRVAFRAWRDYLRMSWATAGLAVRARFRPRDSALDLWPLFVHEWRDSLSGSAAMTNCLHFNLFEATLRRLPTQRLGFYLQENIAWERALVHCWHAAGHGRIVGVPHSTVRYWDLRYFSDARDYARGTGNDLPIPDLVALNGPAARAEFVRGGFPAARLVEVEALRYLHLAPPVPARAESPAGASSALRVLVLGDYVPQSTEQQMRWLSSIAAQLPPDTIYTVKPHPACPIRPEDHPNIVMRLTDKPLDQLLGDCDVAYTSNMTSAAVDAYSFGVPVVSVLDGEALNISPLRGNEAVTYVTNAEELAAALRKRAGRAPAVDEQPFFHLDRQLPRWRRLLGLREAS